MSDDDSNFVTVNFTFIRHGESTDNLRSVWAGWRNSKLSSHGMRQAEALASSFATTKLTAIHSSPLERALLTANALQSKQPNFVPLETSPLLREQNFGQGEGQRYNVQKQPGLSFDEHIAQDKYIPTYNRSDKFPGGESLNDVARRAAQVVEDIILPYVQKATREGTHGMHVVFVSHGIFIAELIAALATRCGKQAQPSQFRGLRNTGWTLVRVKVAKGWSRESNDQDTGLVAADVIEQNSCKHLDTLVRQKGGLGSTTFDPDQKDIRSFFQPRTTSSKNDRSSSG